jgi:hypothetical protein
MHEKAKIRRIFRLLTMFSEGIDWLIAVEVK